MPEYNFTRSEQPGEAPVRPRLTLTLSAQAIGAARYTAVKDLDAFHYLTNEKEAAFLTLCADFKKKFASIFKNTYDELKVYHLSGQWMLIPSEMSDSAPRLLQTLFDPVSSEVVFLRDKTSIADTTICSLIETDRLKWVENEFPGVKIEHRHLLSRLADIHFNLHCQTGQKLTACIELLDKQFAYLIYKDQKLIFANLYAMTAPEDIVYYIFRVNQTLSVNPKDLYIYLSGHWEKKNQIRQLIKTYFLNLISPEKYLPKVHVPDSEQFSTEDFPALLTEI